MIDATYTFYSDVSYITPTVALSIVSDAASLRQMLWARQQGRRDRPSSGAQQQQPVLFVVTSDYIDPTQLELDDATGSVVLITVQPGIAGVRHAVLTLAAASGHHKTPSLSHVHQLRGSLVTELEHCPLPLRTGQQVAAFLLLRCKQLLRPNDLGALLLHTAHLGDQSTLSALVSHALGVHDAAPHVFSNREVAASAAPPYALSSLRSTDDATGRCVMSLTVDGTGVPPLDVPLHVIVVSVAPYAEPTVALPAGPTTTTAAANASRNATKQTIPEAAALSVKLAVDRVLHALRPGDAVAAICGGVLVVPPCVRGAGPVVPRMGSVTPRSDSGGAEATLEGCWHSVVRILRGWAEERAREGRHRRGNHPSEAPQAGGGVFDVAVAPIEPLIIVVDGGAASRPLDGDTNNAAATQNASSSSSPFSIHAFVRRHPVFFNATLSVVKLAAPAAAGQPSQLFAAVTEGMGQLYYPSSEVDVTSVVSCLITKHRQMCLAHVASIVVAPPQRASSIPALVSTSTTYATRDLAKISARFLHHGRVASSETVHGVYEFSSDGALSNSVCIVILQRATSYGGGVDLRIVFPSRIAVVEDGAASVAESWWKATNALRNVLLLPRPTHTFAIDVAWSSIQAVLAMHAPTMLAMVSERLKLVRSLREMEWVLFQALSQLFVLVGCTTLRRGGSEQRPDGLLDTKYFAPGDDDSATTGGLWGQLRSDLAVAQDASQPQRHMIQALRHPVGDATNNSAYATTMLSAQQLSSIMSGTQPGVGGGGVPHESTMMVGDDGNDDRRVGHNHSPPPLVFANITNTTTATGQPQPQKPDLALQRQKQRDAIQSIVATRVAASTSSPAVASANMVHGVLRHATQPHPGQQQQRRELQTMAPYGGQHESSFHSDPSNDSAAVGQHNPPRAHVDVSSMSRSRIDDAVSSTDDDEEDDPLRPPSHRVVHSTTVPAHHGPLPPKRMHRDAGYRDSAPSDTDDDGDDGGIVAHVQPAAKARPMTAYFNDAMKEHVMADPRWLSLDVPGSATAPAPGRPPNPSASSLEAAVTHTVPSGAVTLKSFSLALVSIQGTAAYIEFPALTPLIKHGVTLAARVLLLCSVDRHQCLDIEQTAKLPLAVAGTHAPVEHVFYNLTRGTTYCVIHLATTKDPSQWIAFDDVAIADGIEFTTPKYVVEQLRVADVYARSIVLDWEGNAPSYIVTAQRIIDPPPPAAARGGARGGHRRTSDPMDDEDDVVSGGHAAIATTYHTTEPHFTLTGLLPASVYKVHVAPSVTQRDEAPAPRTTDDSSVLLLCSEASEHIVATAIEPNVLDVTARAVLLNEAGQVVSEDGGDDDRGGGPGSKVLISIGYPPLVVVFRDYQLSIEAAIEVDGLAPSDGTVTALAGRVLDVDIHFNVQVINRHTHVTLMQKRSFLPLKTNIGPFDAVFSAAVTSVSAESVDLVWQGTGDQYLIELLSDQDDDHCIAVSKQRAITVGDLKPSTEYIARIKGKRSVNMVTAAFRTLPGRPTVNAVVVAHSAARKELHVTLPPCVERSLEGYHRRSVQVIQHKVVVWPFDQVLLSKDSNVSETVVLDVAVLQGIHGREQSSGDGQHYPTPFQPILLEVSQVVSVGDERPLESQATSVAVVTDVSAVLAAPGGDGAGGGDSVEVRWFAARQVDDATVASKAFFSSVGYADDVYEAPRRALDDHPRNGEKRQRTFHVHFGQQVQAVKGSLSTTFRLPVTNDLFQQVSIVGPEIAQELCPMYYMLPPPAPSPSLFHTLLFEDHVQLEISHRMNALIDEFVPTTLAPFVEMLLEFISPCFPSVRIPLPVTEMLRVRVPLMLNRMQTSFIDVRVVMQARCSGGVPLLPDNRHQSVNRRSPPTMEAVAVDSGSDAVAGDAPIFLNYVALSRSVAIPTPLVHPITDLEVAELQSHRVVLRWFSNNSTHDVTITSGEGYQSQCRSVQPLVVIEDLNPETCYRAQIKGKESGAHTADIWFVTPPVLTSSFVNEIASTLHVDDFCLAFELPPTRVVATQVSGGEGRIKTTTHVALQPHTSRDASHDLVWSSREAEPSRCTTTLPRLLTLGERWPCLTVESVSDCVANENVAGKIASASSRVQERQAHRIDLVGGVTIEDITEERCVITWMGSASSYLLTLRTPIVSLDDTPPDPNNISYNGGLLTTPTTVRKTACRHILEFNGASSSMYFIALQGDDGPSNTVQFSVIVPPASHFCSVRRYAPSSVTVALPRAKKSAFLVTGCYVTVNDVKHPHTNLTDGEEEFSVALDVSRTLIRHHHHHPGEDPQQRKPQPASHAAVSTNKSNTAAASQGPLRPPLAPQQPIAAGGCVLTVVSFAEPRPIVVNPAASEHQDAAYSMDDRDVSGLLVRYPPLNRRSETVTTKTLPKLHPLTDATLRSVDAASAEVSWTSTDTEFYVEIFQFLPSSASSSDPRHGLDDLTNDASATMMMLEQGGHYVDRQHRREGSKRDDPSEEGQMIVASRASGGASFLSRSVVVSTPHIKLRQLQHGSLHMVRVRGRGCGDVAIEVAFLTQPLFAEKSVSLRRHANGNTFTILVDEQMPDYRCGDACMYTATTIDLIDVSPDAPNNGDGGAGSIVESIRVPPGERGVDFTVTAPLTMIKLVRTLSCEWEGHHVDNNQLHTALAIAKVPRVATVSNLQLVRVDANQCVLQWDCTAHTAKFTVVASPLASLHGGNVVTSSLPKRTMTTTVGEAHVASLTPATLYEVAITEDCAYQMAPNRTTRALTVLDNAPEMPTLCGYFLTPPKRSLGGTIHRYIGGLTIALDPLLATHDATGLMLYYAARVIPDNTIVVARMPCRSDVLSIPPPSLPVASAKPVFVTAVPSSSAPGAPYHADISLIEPAGRLTHRVEWFQVVEVSDRSPLRVNTLNPLQFSDAEVHHVELVRVIHKPQITHVTSKRASIQWETSHEEMRCEVTLANLLQPEQAPTIHRVVDNEISFEHLMAAAAYEVTITPSYQNSPCEALNFVMLTAPRKPRPPTIHVLLLNSVFDLPPTQRMAHATSGQPHSPVSLTVTHTALVICDKESDVSRCSSATDYLEHTQARNVFKSTDTAQRIDLRLRSGRSYVFVFFASVHHPMAVNGILHSKPCVVPHRTDCYAPSNLHVISRTKSSITVGWSSVDVGSKLLRFVVEMAPILERVTQLPAVAVGNDDGHVRATTDGVPPMSVTMSQLYGPDRMATNTASLRSGKFKSFGLRHHIGGGAAAQKEEQQAGAGDGNDPAAFMTPLQRLEYAFEAPSIAGTLDGRQQIVVETSASKPEMHATFSFLVAGVQYAFRVRQVTTDPSSQQATSAWSTILLSETASPPKPVERLQVIGVSSSAIRLAWVDRQSTDADQIAYLVEWKCTERSASTGTSGKRVQDMRVNTCQCEITGLASGLSYRITVTPMNTSGETCAQENATIVVRTEAPQSWKL